MRKKADQSASKVSLPTGTSAAFQVLPGAGAIVALGVMAYFNSFEGQFVFDDQQSILDNPNIRHLWPLWDAMSAPRDTTGGGRPLVNLSLALNYRLGGLRVWGYHAFNLTVHILSSLVLFGIVRWTMLTHGLRATFGHASHGIALTTALLWMVHPLQTESVTYIIQRAESLVGLLYLLTLYCAIRSFSSPRGAWWVCAAIVSCAFGMGSKEVMITAPFMVLLYDRAFLSGSFKEAWRKSSRLYLGLAATWLVLAALVLIDPHRQSAGFGFKHLTPIDYAKTQFGVILHYLRLSFWPDPLCFYYYWPVTRNFTDVLPAAFLVSALVATTVWAFWKRPVLGFVGAWFFLILAPTSSVLPIITEVAAEHRMYLPLAALVVLVAAVGYLSVEYLVRRLFSSDSPQKIGRQRISGALALVMVCLLAYQTSLRNQDYHDPVVLWSDTVRKQPSNFIAHHNLGVALGAKGKVEEALLHYSEALRIKPDFADAHSNIGVLFAGQGRFHEAITHYDEAVRAEPANATAHNNLGMALAGLGKLDDAVEHFTSAIRIKPDFAEAYNNYGIALSARGHFDMAVERYLEALRIHPEYAAAHNNLATALKERGEIDRAILHYKKALRVHPDYAEAHCNLGNALVILGRLEEAMEHYSEAIRIKPNFGTAHGNLAGILFLEGDLAGAWREVQLCRKYGGSPPPALLDQLLRKMPEPNN